jgi:hypothetical protein
MFFFVIKFFPFGRGHYYHQVKLPAHCHSTLWLRRVVRRIKSGPFLNDESVQVDSLYSDVASDGLKKKQVSDFEMNAIRKTIDIVAIESVVAWR